MYEIVEFESKDTMVETLDSWNGEGWSLLSVFTKWEYRSWKNWLIGPTEISYGVFWKEHRKTVALPTPRAPAATVAFRQDHESGGNRAV